MKKNKNILVKLYKYSRAGKKYQALLQNFSSNPGTCHIQFLKTKNILSETNITPMYGQWLSYP